MVRRLIVAAVALAQAQVATAAAPKSPNVDCTRHVYNMTGSYYNVAWQPQSGGAQMQCTSAPVKVKVGTQVLNGCGVPPNTTFAVDFWLDMNNQVYGQLYVTDPSGNQANWFFLGYGYMFGQGCPYIQHDGRTAGVNLNEPANGDIQLFGSVGPVSEDTKRKQARMKEDALKLLASARSKTR